MFILLRNPFMAHEQYTTEIADIKKGRGESSVVPDTLFCQGIGSGPEMRYTQKRMEISFRMGTFS
jgi:hypothetical protein